jgi:hypothetical protein
VLETACLWWAEAVCSCWWAEVLIITLLGILCWWLSAVVLVGRLLTVLALRRLIALLRRIATLLRLRPRLAVALMVALLAVLVVRTRHGERCVVSRRVLEGVLERAEDSVPQEVIEVYFKDGEVQEAEERRR